MTDIIGNQTVRSLWEGLAASRGDAIFLIFQDRRGNTCEYSYRHFNEEIDRTANLFLDLGVEKGECVAVQLRTSPEFIMCLFGLAKIGAVMVPMNDQSVQEECEYILEKCHAVCAVIDEEFSAIYTAIASGGMVFDKGLIRVSSRNGEAPREDRGSAFEDPSLKDANSLTGFPLSLDEAFQDASKKDGDTGRPCCSIDASGAGSLQAASDASFLQVDIEDFAQLKNVQPSTLKECRPLSSDDLAEILFTSGTTSRPKGVELTHCNLLYSGIYGAWEVSLTEHDRMLTTMPACHSNFQLAALTPVLSVGATLVAIEKYSARRFWRQIRDFKATVTQCVAMILRTLMLQPEKEGEQDHCLRDILYFLPVSDREKAAFEERFKVRLLNTYGSTESLVWVLTDLPFGERRWPSVGRVGLSYEVKIVDDEGHEAAPWEVGEIMVKGVPGRTIAKGYHRDPQATAEMFDADGWMHTGDKGYQDEEGWFYFFDRKSSMIKRAGENISTTELETTLAGHPKIAEAAVIGVSDPIRDQAVKAFVRPATGASITEEEVLSYCIDHMAAFKVPSYIEIRDELPHTSSMKVEKKLLK